MNLFTISKTKFYVLTGNIREDGYVVLIEIFLKSLLKKSKCFGHFSGNRTTRMVPPGSTTKIVLVVIHGTWPLLKLPAGVNGKHHALILLK